KGELEVPLPNSQKLVAVDNSAGSGLNIATLIRLKEMFDGNEVDEEAKRYIAVTSRQISNLLNQTEVTSADFNTIKALVKGEVNSFMGFEFIRLELPEM